MQSRLKKLIQMDAASGLVLLAATVLALIAANSSFASFYFDVRDFVILGSTLLHWVNDGLMVIFFFVVGLEIKREMILGELSDPRRAALPMIAAVGGMVVPALLYFSLNPSGPAQAGWGIAMATDIAFAVGVLNLFGRRVPSSLKVFLLSLAIVDDLGAVLVIALFYTSEISLYALGAAGLGLILIVGLQKIKVNAYAAYWMAGILVWFFVLKSGVHATVAGVIIGLMTPIHPFKSIYAGPLQNLLDRLHRPVSFGILPIFALFNTGIVLGGNGDADSLWTSSVVLGVILGLVVGKPIGIVGFSWIAVKLGLALRPRGVDWHHLTAAGVLGGIGFTMSLFITGLAFQDPVLEVQSKTAILIASMAAAFLGICALEVRTRRPPSN